MDRNDDHQHIRVIGHREIEVLDPHRVGDIFLQLPIGNTFNPSGDRLRCCLHDEQRPTYCGLIEIFGPNQFVLVATDGDLLYLKRTAAFSPQTLYSCLSLTYACWSIIVHGLPESSDRMLQAHQRAGTLKLQRAVWTQATFHSNREIFGLFRYIPITLDPRTTTVAICLTDDPTANVSKG